MKPYQYINVELEVTLTVPVPIPAYEDYMERRFDLEDILERAVDADTVEDSRLGTVHDITPSDRYSLKIKR